MCVCVSMNPCKLYASDESAPNAFEWVCLQACTIYIYSLYALSVSVCVWCLRIVIQVEQAKRKWYSTHNIEAKVANERREKTSTTKKKGFHRGLFSIAHEWVISSKVLLLMVWVGCVCCVPGPPFLCGALLFLNRNNIVLLVQNTQRLAPHASNTQKH